MQDGNIISAPSNGRTRLTANRSLRNYRRVKTRTVVSFSTSAEILSLFARDRSFRSMSYRAVKTFSVRVIQPYPEPRDFNEHSKLFGQLQVSILMMAFPG